MKPGRERLPWPIRHLNRTAAYGRTTPGWQATPASIQLKNGASGCDLAASGATFQTGSGHAGRIENATKILVGEVGLLTCHFANGLTRFIGQFRDVGRGIIADNGSQRRADGQAAFNHFGSPAGSLQTFNALFSEVTGGSGQQ